LRAAVLPPRAAFSVFRAAVARDAGMDESVAGALVRCRTCGFTFHGDKLHKPGKCPRCRGTRIRDPLIALEERR
jgi:predicted Zn-ribbon and HTH transcriptional regulator